MEEKKKKRRVLRIRSVEIDVTALVLVLLVADLIIAGFVLYRNSLKRPQVAASAEPIAAVTPSSEPEITPSPVTETKPEEKHPAGLLNVKYEKTAYKPEIDVNDGFQTAWRPIGNNNAYFDFSATFDTMSAHLYNAGNALADAAIVQDGIPMEDGHSYTIFVSVSGSSGGSLSLAAMNADTGAEFGRTTLNLNPELTYYEFPFAVTSGGTGNGRIAIQFGGGAVPAESQIQIYGLRVGAGDYNAAVRTNQIGYVSTDQKRCTFIYTCGDLFDVVNAESGKIEFSGPIVYGRQNTDTGELDYYGDFSVWDTPGTYFIRTQNGQVSHQFTVERDPYRKLRNASLKMLSFQRCGTALGDWAGPLAHAECHNHPANLVYTDSMFEVSGGWHDAGDFGRYIRTGAKAVNDLLLAYLTAPDLFGDDTGGPDSGNGVPDVLDEARYELEWMIRMQEEDGCFFSKVVTQSFPDDNISPENDSQVLFVLASDTISTADAAGSLAIAGIAFKEIDPEFSQRCLECAGSAEKYLQKHRDKTATTNPMEFSAGEYLDDDDRDARFTLEMAGYAATGEEYFLENAKELYEEDSSIVNDVSWKDNGLYGAYVFLACSNGEEDDSDFYEKIEEELKAKADSIMEFANGNSYNTANGLYVWGSNFLTANQGIILAMAYDFTGRQEYLQTSVEQLNYLLGKNCLDMCFVSGFGYRSPMSQHNRLAIAKNTMMPGALSGGPDASREDNITRALPELPPAKIYVDDWRSYSTNEIAIYYNSSLIYLLTAVY